jgi:hypothetical protein
MMILNLVTQTSKQGWTIGISYSALSKTRWANPKWTIQSHGQHWAQYTERRQNKTQNKEKTAEHTKKVFVMY